MIVVQLKSNTVVISEHADGVLEGTLIRKHEWETTTKKASNRSVSNKNVNPLRCLLNSLTFQPISVLACFKTVVIVL